jgi:phenylpropionate dioxygenase-like ring-hydroxylating dioxygenase large terminal subunit
LPPINPCAGILNDGSIIAYVRISEELLRWSILDNNKNTSPEGSNMAAIPQDVIARDSWFDVDKGELDRRVFSDQDIYQEELKKIFARAWNFMCHESQIPEPGDYFLNRIGEDHVIAVRDRNQQVQVLLNSCSHRGNTVCRAEQDNTRSFFCSYHGWNFALDGKLVAIPGEKDFYRSDIDKEALGLQKAAQVSSYKGFVFATLDASAPPLEDYLGWVGRLGIDSVAARGEIEVVNGIQKNRVRCNWKLAVDNRLEDRNYNRAFRSKV